MIRLAVQKILTKEGESVFSDWYARLAAMLALQPGFLAITHNNCKELSKSVVEITLEFQSPRALTAWARSDEHASFTAEINPVTTKSESTKIEFNRVVITGASSGIGYALAEKFLQNSNTTVVAIARRLERLETLSHRYPGRVQTIRADLSDPDTVLDIVDSVENPRLVTHIVHNAGTEMPVGPLSELDVKQFERQLRVNLFAPIEITNQFARQGLDGCKVLFVSSGAAYGSWPGIGSYGVSKAALESACGTYQAERSMNEKVDMFYASVRPGGVHTEMAERLREQPSLIFRAKPMLEEKIITGDILSPEYSAGFLHWVLTRHDLDVFEKHWNINDPELRVDYELALQPS